MSANNAGILTSLVVEWVAAGPTVLLAFAHPFHAHLMPMYVS
jgi:hypothetical protein